MPIKADDGARNVNDLARAFIEEAVPPVRAARRSVHTAMYLDDEKMDAPREVVRR